MINTKKLMKQYYSLCTPAQLYFSLSLVSILGLVYQNFSSTHTYQIGSHKVHLQHHNLYFFLFKIIYVLVWTFLLNRLCKRGWSSASWALILLPLILMFVILALLVFANNKN